MRYGKKEDYAVMDRFLEMKKVEHLDGIFLSHGHKDHAGGLKLILKKYPTDKIYLSGKDDITYKKQMWSRPPRNIRQRL
ncbi:MBL fold metallo-hydrolase [Blautia sp. RD014234]|nr:MBL fold metallo-hydrolase [Blautia parvula]